MERRRHKINVPESLGGQLDRVKAELERLSAMVSHHDPSVPPSEISADWIRGILEARKRREIIFGKLFGDPAWDILLELYARRLEGERPVVTDLCKIAAVPYTTALRWIGNLERAGLIVRTADAVDRRRIWVDLTAHGDESLKRYFRKPETGAGI